MVIAASTKGLLRLCCANISLRKARLAFYTPEHPLSARSAQHFIKWQHNDIYGCSVEVSVKKPEVTLLMRGEGGLKLWVHKKFQSEQMFS